jgi:colanic acid/amylovoran biosynthesis glycosyltransferase
LAYNTIIIRVHLNTQLLFFVDRISTEDSEEFFEKELPFFCDRFARVYVIPLYPSVKPLKYQAENLTVLKFDFFLGWNMKRLFITNFFFICRVYLLELRKTHCKRVYLKDAKRMILNLVYTLSAAKRLEGVLAKLGTDNTILYSYWFKQWAFALALLKYRNRLLKIVTRAHGGDYDEAQVKACIPYRHFELSVFNFVFPVSNYGKNYLMNFSQSYGKKIVTHRLGLDFEGFLAPVSKERLIVVSCSAVIPLKRVHLIAEVFRYLPAGCKWLHFGAGPLLTELRQLASQLNHEVIFSGHVPNKTFTDFLANNSVSCFLNVSDSEGIPVSMMEAIAHGIPLMGPAICGVPEIVTPQTGFLIPKDFQAREVAKFLFDLHAGGKFYNEEFRRGIVEFYRNNFRASGNYTKLATQLLTL